MRIIAGTWRSRRLLYPTGAPTRPIPDRVKESVFSILGSLYECPGTLPGLHIADVFAGSGSLGLEALSRGAADCCFFESNRSALAILRKNVDTLGASARCTILTGDAWASATLDPRGSPFDLVTLDPPYRDSADASSNGPVRKFLAKIAERDDNRPLVVLHHAANVRYVFEDRDSWKVFDERLMGSNRVTFLRR
ncbi:MAG: 16S rRNA (guanine(966)-N(2))-methyltransferase RsmD [Planctomycetota bacterium]